jgi:hypothetical protein
MFLMPGSRARVRPHGPVLLQTLFANNTQTIGYIANLGGNILPGAYSVYELVLDNIFPVTNAVSVVLQVAINGAIESSGYVACIAETNSVNNTFTQSSFTIGIPLTSANNANNMEPGISGVFRIMNPSNTTSRKTIGGQTFANASGTAARTAIVSGYWDGGNGPITGWQIVPASGSLSTGIVRVYGWP